MLAKGGQTGGRKVGRDTHALPRRYRFHPDNLDGMCCPTWNGRSGLDNHQFHFVHIGSCSSALVNRREFRDPNLARAKPCLKIKSARRS